MAKNYFDPVDPKVNFPELEEKVLKYWKENKRYVCKIWKGDKSNSNDRK